MQNTKQIQTVDVPPEIQSIISNRISDLVDNTKIQTILMRMKHDGMSDKDIQQFVINIAIGTLYGDGVLK